MSLSEEDFLSKHHYDLATPSLQQYLKIKSQHQDSIVLFQVGDFFEMFFEDAIIAHKALGIYLTHKGTLNNEKIPMSGIPVHSYKRYLTQLAKKNFTIVLCEQVESIEEAKKRGYKAIVARDITRIITPGTILDSEMFDSSENNFLLSVVAHNKVASIAYIDISTNQFYVFSTSYDNLVSDILKLAPAEILVSDTLFVNLVKNVKKALDVKVMTYPDHFFSKHKAKEDFLSFFHLASLNLFTFSDIEFQAISMILNYLKISRTDQSISLPKSLNNKDNIHLDFATIESLNLKKHVFKTINATKTPQGYRLLQKNLLSPLKNEQMIKSRLKHTRAFYDNTELNTQLRSRLEKMTDIERELSSTIKSHQNLLLIAKNLKIICDIAQMVPDFWTENVSDIENISNSILNNIVDDLDKTFVIKSNFNQDLQNLHNRYHQIQKNLEIILGKYFSHSSTAKITKNNLIGLFIEVSKKQATNISADLILKHSTTTSHRYTSQEMMALEEEQSKIEVNIRTIETTILDEFYNKIRNNITLIRRFVFKSAMLDLFTNFAFIAHDLFLVEPIILASDETEIVNGFHIYLTSKSVRNSCKFDSSTRNFVLTGPNMSGKSTFLRQNAIIYILSQIGCFVPAESAKLSIVDNIFSRIGASDDIEKGHSTFMVEMLETAAILHNATKRSFVVLDEVGRGTSTTEGEVIAHEILRYIHDKIQCKSIFATHYHDITNNDFAYSKNITVDLLKRENSVLFNYKIIDGFIKNSFAIYTAQIAGIPVEIINACKQRLKQ